MSIGAGTLVALSVGVRPGRTQLPIGPIPSPSYLNNPHWFFTLEEWLTIEQGTALFIPTDVDPGAIEAEVVNYIDKLLGSFYTALDNTAGANRIFAGGPFGNPKTFGQSPRGDFAGFLPLPRVKRLAWERECARLRDVYRRGIQDMNEIAARLFALDLSFIDLLPLQQEAVMEELRRNSQDFFLTFFDHTMEGMYADPVYGGNRNGVGWVYIGWEGDAQPIGYSAAELANPGACRQLDPVLLERAGLRRVLSDQTALLRQQGIQLLQGCAS
jgi:gluconate 2-dehydrogenase gamma chain